MKQFAIAYEHCPFFRVSIFLLEVLGVKLVPGIEEGAVVEGSALGDGVATI